MKSLEKWQFISFLSRMSAMFFGLVQSFVILRILSVSDWGIIQLVVSVGASLGIYQHLGLASASNREIAASNKNTDIFKIFITTVGVRYLVTIPLSIGLFVFAPKIAEAYKFTEILIPLRVYAGVLLLQGCQAILNAVISGTKRFKELFIFQGLIALASIIIYVPLVYFYNVMGFFYALFLHEALKSSLLLVIAFRPYLTKLKVPTIDEAKIIFRNLFSLGMAIYIVKIIVINWEKAGPNLLGFIGNAEMIGLFSFGLLFAKKLMHVSDAVTDVNLPVFSGKYAENIKEFKILFLENFNKVFSMIVFFAMSAIYWARELIAILIGDSKYDAAIPLLLPMVFAFIFFSLLDIVKSSLAIPAKLKKEMIMGFFLMLVTTIVFYLFARTQISPLSSMAYGMLSGSALGFFALAFFIQRNLKFTFFAKAHFLVLVQALVISYSGSLENFFVKIIAYTLFTFLYVTMVLQAKFISKHDLQIVVKKSLGYIKKK